MKNFTLFILIALAGFFSCESDDTQTGTALFAVPQVQSLAELRGAVQAMPAQQTNSDGKIYVTHNLLFYIAQESGVHIFDNSDPTSPTNELFLNIPGVHDIAVKGNYLYADNYVDLLVFDISDLSSIELVRTVENSIQFYPVYPDSAEYYDYLETPGNDEIITGFTLESRTRPRGEQLDIFAEATSDFESSGGNSVGTGGSYAKFQINNNALYTTDSHNLNVFNITSPENAFFDKAVYMDLWFGGGEFETLFKQKEFLFVGATNGMYIVNAADEFNPVFISGFAHATACDPVVVHAETAYITVRGGSTCGAIDDQVNVIDISDVANPQLISTYLLNQPRGLGIWDGRLYVCNPSGINVFNAADPANLVLATTYASTATDVIALPSHLIAVAPNKVIQMAYGENFTLTPISEVNF